jgi:FMN phosphatase YigB (HAD superfamily)
VDKNNGIISNLKAEGEHLYIITDQKHLALFDILQQKKVGGYFNDFTFAEKDKLPDEKSLSSV